MLEVRGIDAFYGDLQALHTVTLTVARGEIVTLVGANGSGKTTTHRRPRSRRGRAPGVEQNVRQALATSRRGYVLENGRVVLEGTGAELLASDATQRAYPGR